MVLDFAFLAQTAEILFELLNNKKDSKVYFEDSGRMHDANDLGLENVRSSILRDAIVVSEPDNNIGTEVQL